MSCQICGSASATGAKLCSDCRAARKRAYDATITQPLLAIAGQASAGSRSPNRSRKSGRSNETEAERASRKAAATAAKAALPVTESPRRARTPALLVVFLLALLAGLYGLHRLLATPKTEGEAFKPVDRVISTDTAAAQAPQRPLPAAAPSAAKVPDEPVLGITQPVDGEAAEAATRGVPAQAAAKRAIPVRAPAPVADTTALITVPPPAPAPAPVMEAKPAPRADPWQQMSEAIGRCSREGFFGRVVCEQRVRLQYCDGHWGQVPQCPGGPAADR